MKKFVLLAGCLIAAMSFAACGNGDVGSTDYGDTGNTSDVSDVEADPFFFPYCEIAVEKNPMMFSSVEGCAEMYTTNEAVALEGCLTEDSEEFCNEMIQDSRQVFTDCVNGTNDTMCW